MFLISDLVSLLESYLDDKSIAKIYEAYLFGAEAHDGQKRKTGEPYIYHPIAVARILAELKSDPPTIIAAILHDVIEDTPISKEQIKKQFGYSIASMVDGVSKLHSIQFSSLASAQAESFRKMMLAMSKDIRVILIKLADRLHNMRTLYGMPINKRRRISKETLDIYVPIAERLGMYDLMLELEDLAFGNIHPLRRRILENALRKTRSKSRESIDNVILKIKSSLKPLKIAVGIKYREKSLYSVYKKMRNKQLKFSKLNDIYALRIITDSVDNCYRILGTIHNLYQPVPGRFKDYIAIPKTNGYQSLHTVLFAHKREMVEIQIRTEDMDQVAESGIASHWQYKAGDNASNLKVEEAARQWMHQVLELQNVADSSEEFMESLKVDLLSDKVYVFTPKGEIRELPRGATALDFAYAVHTDVGDKCHQVIIDDKYVPLGARLRNGQTVTIITDEQAHPLPSWLDIVATGKASSSIKNSLHKIKTSDALKIGKRILEQSLKTENLKFNDVSDSDWEKLLKKINLESINDLYKSIGTGERIAEFIVSMLTADEGHTTTGRFKSALKRIPFLRGKKPLGLQILGTEGLSVQYAKCCYAIPGDKIVGHLSSGRGIMVHQSSCNNLPSYRKQPERLVEIAWADNTSGDFVTEIRISVDNRPGALASIATEISRTNSNIDNININDSDGSQSDMCILLRVKDQQHLASIMNNLKKLPFVKNIYRYRK